MARVRICLFGSFRVQCSACILAASDFPSRKAKRVLELLAIAGGRIVSKDRLIEAVWGDRLPRNPVATLEQTVSILRSALAACTPQRVILTAAGGYQLNRAVADIDIFEFDALVGGAATAPPPQALLGLRAAVGLAVGGVLDDEQYAEWSVDVRAQYAHRVEAALLSAARLALIMGAAEEALALSQRAQAHALVPCEEAYHLSVSALVDLGSTAAAQALLDEAEQALQTEFGVGLSPELEALRSTLRPRRPLAPGDVQIGVRLTLSRPLPRVPFVGREADLCALAEAIRSVAAGGNEFVIVEGAPGMGKSRLLHEVSVARGSSAMSPASPGLSPVSPRSAVSALSVVAAQSGCEAPVTLHQLRCVAASRHFPRLAATRIYRRLGSSPACPAGPQVVATGGEAVTELFHQLARLIDEAGPVIVLIDDLHWADDASVAILNELVQPGIVRGLGVIATMRPLPEDARAVVPLPSSRLVLAPLSERDLEGLGIMGGHAETGGHPGVLASCIEASMGGGLLTSQAVTQILQRAHQGGPFGYQVLVAAAAFEQPFDVVNLAFVLGVSTGTLTDALTELRQLGIVTRTGGRGQQVGWYRFSDELTRRVLQSTAPHRVSAVRSLHERRTVHLQLMEGTGLAEALG